VDDPDEDEKLRLVSAGLDRVFSLLQLQGAYDSNEFSSMLFEISREIRGSSAAQIPGIFDKHLVAELKERRAQATGQAFSYSLFKPMSVDRLNTRFTRYFFGRIERLLSVGMNMKMRHELKDLVTLKGAKNGFHVEHILSRNDRNLAVLLLKGKDNISSSNETYEMKLKSYANSLYWNETLRSDTYKSKLDFSGFVKENSLAFRPLDEFGPEELDERQKLLFDLSAMIWIT
jgi:hypothetical protein